MTKLQFRILYREFLFRLVDREVLSPQEGDSGRLLARFATGLIILSLLFTLAVLQLDNGQLTYQALLISAWATEHALIATTMLLVGLFAVLSWDSTFPDRRDVLVLAPLPVRASTMFLAKVTSLAAALSLTVAIFNAAPGFLLPLTVASASAGFLEMFLSPDFYRMFAAYWITMFASGAFILCSVLCAQGIAAQLPRALFLRMSALLQVAALCLFVGVYFLEPGLTSPQALASGRNQHLLAWLPSYWFLGLFQRLNGSLDGMTRPTLVALANRASIGLALAVAGAGTAFLLSYVRTLRKIIEQPDIVPASRRLSWLPRLGNGVETAITHFTIRTLLRSRQHRVILSFYSGIGFAIVILFMRTPFAQRLSAGSASNYWNQVSLPLLASSFVMMCFWTLGIRAVFALPVELRANWIFRTTQIRGAPDYFAASRRAIYVLALALVLSASAALFLSIWPWAPAAGHLLVLALAGITVAEICLYGFHKIPFACSYLPGKTNLHMIFCSCLIFGLSATYWSADFERRALSDQTKYAWMLALLCIAAGCARWRTAWANSGMDLRFEEELAPVISELGLHRDGILPVETPLDASSPRA